MKLFHLLQIYEFDGVIPVINGMFPGTNKFRPQLGMAYDMLLAMKPANNSKAIRYKVMPGGKPDHSHVDAEDSHFGATREVYLGKDISRGQDVDLSNAELLTNASVSPCL